MDAAGAMRRHLVQCARQCLVQNGHICGVLWCRREDGIGVGSAMPSKRLDLLLVQLLRVVCGRMLRVLRMLRGLRMLRMLLLRMLRVLRGLRVLRVLLLLRLLRLLRVTAIVAAACLRHMLLRLWGVLVRARRLNQLRLVGLARLGPVEEIEKIRSGIRRRRSAGKRIRRLGLDLGRRGSRLGLFHLVSASHKGSEQARRIGRRGGRLMDTGLELVRRWHLEMLDTLVLLFVVFVVVDFIVLPLRLRLLLRHRRRLWVLMLVLELELGMRLGG